MADWYGTCRSNYFRVKDVDAFTTWLNRFDATLISKQIDDVMHYGFISDDQFGGMPQYWPEDENGDMADEPVTLSDQLGDFLAEGQVAIIIEVGAEKARYLSGHAWAIDHTNTCKFIDLMTAILAEAYDAFPSVTNITSPEY